MKFYDCTTAPSPRRVRIFLAEKGIAVPSVQVDLRNNEQLTPSYRAINPDATVPALELDDGTRINDAIGICVYFEAIHPQPTLMGETPKQKALIAAWQREVERNGFYAVMEAFRNWARGLKGRALPGPYDYEQIPALAERGRLRVGHFFERMDARLAQSEYIVGDRYTIADVTALVTVDFAAVAKLPVPENCAQVRRWYSSVSARPSAKA